MLLRTTPVPAALDNPIPSAVKRVRQWANGGRESSLAPGVSVQDLQVKYGPDLARAPKLKRGTFRVPLGTTTATYERARDQFINTWLGWMAKQGWDPVLDSQHRVDVSPYIYPARDDDNIPDLGARQFMVRAWFQLRSPEPIQIELDSAWLQPVRATGA